MVELLVELLLDLRQLLRLEGVEVDCVAGGVSEQLWQLYRRSHGGLGSFVPCSRSPADMVAVIVVFAGGR